MRAPSSASHTLIGTSQCTLSPLRWKNGCSPTRVLTIRSPRGPPNGPAFPSPATRTCAPESTPAGTDTATGSTTRRTPRPRHAEHRPSRPAPLAPHFVQAENRWTSSRTFAPPTTSAKDRSTPALTPSPRRPSASASPAPPLAQRVLGAGPVPVMVVHLTRCGIAENSERLGDLLEELPRSLVPEIHVGRVLPREALIGSAHLARQSRRRDTQDRVVVATHEPLLLLLAQILEVGIDHFAFFWTRRALALPTRRARAGRLALRLGFAIHDLRELVRRLAQALLGALHPLDVLALEGFARLSQRVVDRLSIALGQLGAVLAERALSRVD